MQEVNSKKVLSQFDKKIYQTEPLIVTSDIFWDGGIRADHALLDKANFYYLADKMSEIIQEVILLMNEDVFIGKELCESGSVYAHWSDLRNYALFREVSAVIRKNKYYRLTLPEDKNIVDLIVESNFRHFSYFSLYIPPANIVMQPTCHSDVWVYSPNNKEIGTMLGKAAERHSDTKQRIFVKDVCNR